MAKSNFKRFFNKKARNVHPDKNAFKVAKKRSSFLSKGKVKSFLKGFNVFPFSQKNKANKENELLEKLKRLEEENKRLKDAYLKDTLTRAYNRKALEHDLELFTKKQLVIGFAFLDADHFKRINDTYGHQVGDEVLCKIIDTIYETIRELKAKVYRYGGEEFAIVATGVSENAFKKILQKVRVSISKVEFFANNTKFNVTISIGYCTPKSSIGKTPKEIIEIADKAVYVAKKNGRDRIERGSMEVNYPVINDGAS